MSYTEYNFTISPIDPTRDVLVAELCELGFESFVETENGVLAYVSDPVDETLFPGFMAYGFPDTKIEFEKKEIEDRNWNKEWESNFELINIDNRCIIRAPFHAKKSDVPLEVIIQPQMSFGTGHHETTFLISQILLDLDLNNKKVLDMGCGTGVLAILAEKLGANELDAIDIDQWSYNNTLENIALNNSEKIEVFLGDKSQLEGKEPYDIILANINRNILLNDMDSYVRVLKPGGTIIFSGFYNQDLNLIQEKGEEFGLSLISYREKNDWIAAIMKF